MSWTYRSASEAFLRLESEMGLLERQIDDVNFWEYVRFSLHRDILEELDIIGQAHAEKGMNRTEQLRGLYLWGRNIVRKNPFLSGQHDVLFFGHPRRKLGEDDLWWDIYCDPVIDELPIDYQYVEYDYQLSHKTPPKTERVRYVDLINYSGTLYKRFSDYTFDRDDRLLLQQIDERIKSEFDVQADVRERVSAELLDRRVTLPLYEHLLECVEPNLVVLVVSYGKESFVEACKRLDIPVVELQHGTVTEYHMGYSFPDAEKQTAPDYFLSFGDFWRESVQFSSNTTVVSCGYPYLERQYQRFSGGYSSDGILFISQGTVGESLSEFAVELADRTDDYEVLYKLHPGEYADWERRYPWLAESDVTVVEGDGTSLYRLFAESSIQVGVYSTAIYEGLKFGLETFLVDLPGIEYMEQLLSESNVRKVSDPSEILSNVDGTSRFDADRYFRPDAIEQIESTLNSIR